MRPGLLPLLLAMLSGCSVVNFSSEPPEPTLADLAPVTLPETREELPRVSLAELADIYREVLQITADPATRLQVQHRLADIEMLGSEAALALAETDRASFAGAIAAYQALLRENPANPLNDQLLYQLSKAYEFSGDTASSLAALEQLSASFPNSEHFLEAEFRKAESYFASADYRAAELAYSRVIESGEGTPFYINALYMQGWARFKQTRYGPAIAAFTSTLDQLVPPDNRIDALARGQAELARDCLRVLAVVFSYLEGADTIASAYEQLGVRPYQHLLYRELGDLYLEQERFRDSAETYKAYTSEFPQSRVAHLMQLRVIESYDAGGFPDLIVLEKQHYVEVFGVTGPYWLQSDLEARDAIRPRLQRFIEELASYHHALAQDAARQGKQGELAAQHYRSAGDYYQLYIDSFPLDPAVPAMGFLLAESRFEAGDYAAAVHNFEWVAYQYSKYERAADAGYSAILGWQRLAGSAAPADLETLQRERIDSELRFAAVFADDSRAPMVLGHAAGALIEQSEYQRAIIAAATLARWQPEPGLMLSALLVMGHSHFELQQYNSAEQAYREALAALPDPDQRRADIVDRLAASVYRQGEQAVARQEHLEAARQFSRVMALAPRSPISVNAQFDAASNYISAGKYTEANRLLIDFRQRYPDHGLSASIAPTLVGNYEQLEQWGAAAAELDTVYAAQAPGEEQRQALYLAAEYYDKAGQHDLAIARYRSYAHAWPQPFALRMEAMNRLAALYQRNGQERQRHFWLAEMIAAHAAAGAGQSERSVYLAALASSVLADGEYQAYRAINLRHPIKQSLKKKKAAMQRTLDAYTRTGEYGVQQFSTLASYRIAKVYQQLSVDLMKSERPANIDDLALEQYEFMLEEQAYPFEEKAIAIHESNARRSWDGIYDQWVIGSFSALAELLPARYRKTETRISISRDIY